MSSAPVIECRLCGAPAVGIYYMPRGCACASDPMQALCAQHVHSAEPLEGMWFVPTAHRLRSQLLPLIVELYDKPWHHTPATVAKQLESLIAESTGDDPMNDLLDGNLPAVPLYDQITCVLRELDMRRRVYPHWIAQGKMKQTRADEEIRRMEAVLATLRQIEEERAHG